MSPTQRKSASNNNVVANETGQKRTRDSVYQILRKKILTLELPPGSDLDEAKLAREIGVSRTPLREALLRLSGEQLVKVIPNRGSEVTPIHVTDFPRYIESLSLTQRAINHLAALRRTRDDINAISAACRKFEVAVENDDVMAMADSNRQFHAAIADATRNSFMTHMYSYLLDSGIRLALISFSYGGQSTEVAEDVQHRKSVIQEHRAILNAINLGDSKTAEELGNRHAVLFQQRFLKSMQQTDLDDISIP